ncbi:hypothetical protein [Paenibacillus wulumuqiensis]|uniref:hypothetical protein n=1 Tax=Paenibacillus wulumuqiensis TaxID=1567107 RepID=UPI000619204B|nr:hypothetical protein [Paenibacillus wulumuqiensis]
MTVTIPEADVYVNENCIDVEDWQAAEEATKTRYLNVAARTLNQYYRKYIIPDNAVYEFANTLAILYNDTGRLQRQGIASFGLTGVFSLNNKEGSTTMPYDSLRKFIPQTALDLIGNENDVNLTRKSVKWTVM